MTDDVTTRAIAERLQSWSRTMVLGRDTFTSLTRMAEAMDAVATRLLELLPAGGGDATTDPPFDAWVFVRDVLVRGTNIEQDSRRIGRGYEMHSMVLDAAARELADRIKPHLKPQEAK